MEFVGAVLGTLKSIFDRPDIKMFGLENSQQTSQNAQPVFEFSTGYLSEIQQHCGFLSQYTALAHVLLVIVTSKFRFSVALRPQRP